MAFPMSSKPNLGKRSIVDPGRNLLIDGFAPAFDNNPHPLKSSEASHQQRTDEMNFSILRSVQGIQAPLKLMMERKAASKVGRLPFLPSSNLMLEVLQGNDVDMDFSDIYNDPNDYIERQLVPSIVTERQLNIPQSHF